MAIYLAGVGCAGPFEIGNVLCEIDTIADVIHVVAKRRLDKETGQFTWSPLGYGVVPRSQSNPNLTCGAPAPGIYGSLVSFVGHAGQNGVPTFVPSANPLSGQQTKTQEFLPLKMGYDPMWS
ncbi:hypothetical protein VHEMI04771 [[Torrubiella] hemipterigena]|uniref:Uncharacterized protein n=1 Tax=[Torrubiella] hemipterigena TaxID=1531966 RepID=A0A0A1TET5_9HYPO|nr:hypothetical protein VHEMI04771 [[Torrubiella] hemipterigena]